MTKYIIASMTALTLIVTPMAASAQTNNETNSTAPSEKMKGPPNANGMTTNGSSSEMKSGRSEDSATTGNSNGAAAAKATGADKK